MDLSYERWGEGERSLLLLHGFTGNRASWDHLRPWLNPEVRAIAVDLPGHGQSPDPGAGGTEAHQAVLEGLVALLDRLGEEEVDVLGYSQGARIALGLALRAPERVHRLVLESAHPGLRREKERAERRRRDAALAASLREEGVAAFVARWEALPLFAGIRRLPRALQDGLRARRLSHRAEGLAGALECLGLGAQPDYWPMLPRLGMPALLLTGKQDAKFTALAKRMSGELRLGWHRAFEGCGHAPHLEHPSAYCEEVLAFLAAPEMAAPRDLTV